MARPGMVSRWHYHAQNKFVTFLSSDGATAFHVTICLDLSGISISELQQTHKLPHLTEYFDQYMCSVSNGSITWNTTNISLDVWHKFHIQQHSTFQSHSILKSQVVQAYPPSDEEPFGICDAVLLE